MLLIVLNNRTVVYLLVSVKLDMPLIMENNTNGTAINFSKLMKILPKGSIQLIVNSLQPILLESKAYNTPSTSPAMIFVCNGIFFILEL
jgi:hypothetical protein